MNESAGTSSPLSDPSLSATSNGLNAAFALRTDALRPCPAGVVAAPAPAPAVPAGMAVPAAGPFDVFVDVVLLEGVDCAAVFAGDGDMTSAAATTCTAGTRVAPVAGRAAPPLGGLATATAGSVSVSCSGGRKKTAAAAERRGDVMALDAWPEPCGAGMGSVAVAGSGVVSNGGTFMTGRSLADPSLEGRLTASTLTVDARPTSELMESVRLVGAVLVSWSYARAGFGLCATTPLALEAGRDRSDIVDPDGLASFRCGVSAYTHDLTSAMRRASSRASSTLQPCLTSSKMAFWS